MLGPEPRLREGFELLRFDQGGGIIPGRKKLAIPLLDAGDIVGLRGSRNHRAHDKQRNGDCRYPDPPSQH